MSDEIDVEIRGIRNLVNTVKELYNFDFSDYAMTSFKRRIARVLALYSLSSIDELIGKLRSSRVFYEEFLKEITVNTTEMFRDPSFWRKLRNDVLPVLASNPTIRVWHAACSSGEEVYSMAILLKQMNLLHKSAIYATDINSDVLAVAKSGAYSLSKMDLNASNYQRFEGPGSLSDYYTVKEDKIVFDPSLVKNVTFRTHDLALGAPFSRFDLILCRNVMIYFNVTLQDRVVSLFHESLFRNAYLAVGSKETIAWCKSADKFATFCADEKIYKRIKD